MPVLAVCGAPMGWGLTVLRRPSEAGWGRTCHLPGVTCPFMSVTMLCPPSLHRISVRCWVGWGHRSDQRNKVPRHSRGCWEWGRLTKQISEHTEEGGRARKQPTVSHVRGDPREVRDKPVES
jgi:hypothetical protein